MFSHKTLLAPYQEFPLSGSVWGPEPLWSVPEFLARGAGKLGAQILGGKAILLEWGRGLRVLSCFCPWTLPVLLSL